MIQRIPPIMIQASQTTSHCCTEERNCQKNPIEYDLIHCRESTTHKEKEKEHIKKIDHTKEAKEEYLYLQESFKENKKKKGTSCGENENERSI